jgi:hypothetical protein
MKTVQFLRDDYVTRVGEEPFLYKEGSIHELRDDRADYRIQNGIAIEVKPNIAENVGMKVRDAVDPPEAPKKPPEKK